MNTTFDADTPRGIIIIGSGPSLATVDVAALKNYPTIAFNRSFIAYDEWGFSPNYYVCIDHIALKDNLPEIKSLAEEGRIEKIFVRDSAKTLGLPALPGIYFLGIVNQYRFSTDLGALGMFNNVAAVSIQILAALGYRRILMLGIDARYETQSTAEIMDQPYHLRATRDDGTNHFRSDYYGKGCDFTRHNMEKQMSGWQALTRALPASVQVRNATEGTALTCIPKISLKNGLRWIKEGKYNATR